MAFWMEDLTEDSFKICLREVKIFDGLHKGTKILSKKLYTPGVSESYDAHLPLVDQILEYDC